MTCIDFRSDTVTVPTEQMREAMFRAEVGDDVYCEDATVRQLESASAKLLGKDAALFVPTGTMGNLTALMVHATPGQEVILEENSHIYKYEVGGMARLAGLQAKTLKGKKGILEPEDVRHAIRGDDIHYPETGLICLENTHNMSGGNVMPLDTMEAIYRLASERKIPVHLDGARFFNAAVCLGVKPSEVAEYTDSVMFCLSKGLCAPVGSMLVGNETFIEKARKIRKMLGGGMRQVGVLAAPGIIALEQMPQRLVEDHENAKRLAEGLCRIEGVEVDLDATKTNIVRVDFSKTGVNTSRIKDELERKNFLANCLSDTEMRFVTHKYITSTDVDRLLSNIEEILYSNK